MRPLRPVGIATAALVAAIALVPVGPGAYSAAKSDSSAAATTPPSRENQGSRHRSPHPGVLGKFERVVVIYQENHSFDNLFGAWGSVGGDKVDGVRQADLAHTTQIGQDSVPLGCLPQNDVNLTSPPLPTSCVDAAHDITASAFENRPFTIDDYIKSSDKTCPAEGVSAPTGVLKDSPGALAGGCTRDLVHKFYQEKFQIDQGKQDRYVIGSDAVGLVMGTYDTKQLPIYQYLHEAGAPNYVIADRFFQGANGGSFLNHQWLIAGRAPYVDPGKPIPGAAAVHSVIDSNGMPTSYPYYKATGTVVDGQLTVTCPESGHPGQPVDTEDYKHACGNFAVNTVQPANQPYNPKGAFIPLIDDAKYPNIGDRLTDKGISWAWYSGGWDAAEAGTPGKLFQYHHQPFNYFEAYGRGEPGRRHLQDESDFIDAASIGNLPTVSFVKPYGAENEHPGYASATNGSKHLVDLIQAVVNGPQAKDTLVIVTYDEFGGQWDHVSPPGPGSPTKGAHDAFGPGTRIPALLVSAGMTHSGVDHTSYDTTSILTTLEHAFHLKAVGIRDTKVKDLRKAVRIGTRG